MAERMGWRTSTSNRVWLCWTMAASTLAITPGTERTWDEEGATQCRLISAWGSSSGGTVRLRKALDGTAGEELCAVDDLGTQKNEIIAEKG